MTPSLKAAWLLLVFLAIGGVAGYLGGSMSPLGQQSRTVTVTHTATPGAGVDGPVELVGSIEIDGSSTVYPITEAAAEEFMKLHPKVSITVGISGTGGGFKRFVRGETDINDASRPILKSEAALARENGVEWIEVPIALEGLVIAVHPSNTWVDCLTISELREIWSPDSRISRWSQVRPGWPDQPIKLYGAGPDSGTFDYFTERVVGKAKAQRTDYVASEDDNVLVEGVAAEPYSLGYIPFAYVAQAHGRVKAVPVRDDAVEGSSCIEPSDDTVKTLQYPLARPLFIYINKHAWTVNSALREFVLFYLENGARLVRKVAYTPLPEEYYAAAAGLLRYGVTVGLYGLLWTEFRDAGPH